MTYSVLDEDPVIPPPVPVIALAGWCVPGLGYWLIGERKRAIFSGASILAVFLLGLLIAGVRCIDVPGFDEQGSLRRVGRSGATVLGSTPFRAIIDRPWFIPQVMTGPAAVGASIISVNIASSYPKATARLWDIGTLYTAVAGMLNLLVIIDSSHRASRIREENPQLGPM